MIKPTLTLALLLLVASVKPAQTVEPEIIEKPIFIHTEVDVCGFDDLGVVPLGVSDIERILE